VAARLVPALGALGAVALLLARLAPAPWSSGAGAADGAVVRLATVAAWGCLARLAYVLLAVALPLLRRRPTRPARRPGLRAGYRLAARLLGVSTAAGLAAGFLVAAPAGAAGPGRPGPPPYGPGGPFDRPVAATARVPRLKDRVSVDHPVEVRRGDTLWAIAARSLGARASPGAVAAAWPRWYAANRHAIGPDPDRILPGRRLVPPRPDPGDPS
jgi:hypothetical protein